MKSGNWRLSKPLRSSKPMKIRFHGLATDARISRGCEHFTTCYPEGFSHLQDGMIGFDHLHHRKAIFGPDSLKHAVNMVLDGLFRKVQS